MNRQKLPPDQKRSLCDWVLTKNALGSPPTHKQIIDFAGQIAKLNGYTDPMGSNWINSFFRRNPDIKNLESRKFHSLRDDGETTKNIKEFFTMMGVPTFKEVQPENHYNMAEIGIIKGLRHNGLVLGRLEKDTAIIKHPKSHSWVTVIECISAVGQVLGPLVIFKGKSVQQHWFPEKLNSYESWNFIASNKGWTNEEIALVWLKRVFIPHAKPAKEGEKRIIVDGHASHRTHEFMFECQRNNIYLILLAPHASHVLQPLDVAVFSPVKNAYRRELYQLAAIDDFTLIDNITFTKCYLKAKEIGLTTTNIIEGWKSSGLWPLSVERPLMNPMTKKKKTEECPETPPELVGPPSEVTDDSLIQTPKSSSEVRSLLKKVSYFSKGDRMGRHLMNKIIKGFEEITMDLVALNKKISLLEHQIEEMRPKKRRKVS